MESGPAIILKTLDRHLTGRGAIRLFGGGALVLGYGRVRQTQDADLLLDDAECRALIDDAGFGEALEAAQTELDPLGLYITHIFGPEQEILSSSWRERCKQVQLDGLKNLEVWVLGAVDLVLTKLGRGDEGDFADIRFLLDTKQVSASDLRAALISAQVPDELSELFEVASSKLKSLLSGIHD